MIAATALEVLLIALAAWQLVVVRRSLRADRARQAADRAVAETDQAGGRADVPPR